MKPMSLKLGMTGELSANAALWYISNGRLRCEQLISYQMVRSTHLTSAFPPIGIFDYGALFSWFSCCREV